MNNQQTLHSQQIHSQEPMPMQMGRRMSRRERWRQRIMGTPNQRPLTLRQDRTIPKWLIGQAVVFFFIAFVACTFVFGNAMEFSLAIISSLSVLLFFYLGQAKSEDWVLKNERTFIRNVFVLGLLIRLAWSMYCYFFFNPEYYGTAFGDAADVEWYMPFAQDLAQWIQGDSPMSLSQIIDNNSAAIDDVGYPMWLAIGYAIWGDWSDVFIPFLVKCLAGAYCAVCIYRVTSRHFGEGAARMAAIFVALNPNMIYWCGNMFKETEMVFLCCLCVELVDRTFTSGSRLTFKSLLPGVLAGMAVFFFRAPLAIVLFMAMFAHVVMASSRVMSLGKKIIAGVMVAIVLLVGMGDRLRTQTESLVEEAQSDTQQRNMEWRSKSEGGNEFAKYAGKTVFAPLIFTIPFPTFNIANEGQILQRQLSGGNYIKNILSFFVILVMFIMLLRGDWRKHVFILAYTLGYLMTLVLSNFAQSSRFHMPIWPMLMLFAAYGIQLAKSNSQYRSWFTVALVVEVVACLAWNWFKLKGRGMI